VGVLTEPRAERLDEALLAEEPEPRGRRIPTGVAVVALVLVYVGVIALGDARAASGSDAGGKLATVAAMADHSSWAPDLGYWAEDADPDGLNHPLWHTTPTGGQWLQATSLPFALAAVPLWTLGGAGGVLLLTIAGGVIAALAARRLAQQLGAGEGWAAFWLVGAAGPVLVYTGDFWEHAPAAGLALLAISLALSAETPWRGLVAGLVGGLAVVLRAEMLLYVGVFGIASLAIGDERRRLLARPRRVLALAAGLAVPVVLNAGLERLLVDEGVRDGRAGEVVSGVGQGAATRLTDAAVTSIGLFPTDEPMALLLGALTLLCLVILAVHVLWPEKVGRELGVLAAVAVGLLYAIRLLSGLGFVPGFLMVAPLAVVGAIGARTPRERLLAATGLGALPLVWLTAWQGNHVAQWCGRYLLLSGALLTIVATSVLTRRDAWRGPMAIVVAAAVSTAVVGAGWHIERTSTIADAVAVVESAPDDVVIVSDMAHLGREGGAGYGDHRWVRSESEGDPRSAVATALASGAERIDLVVLVDADTPDPEAPDLDGVEPVGPDRRVDWILGQHLLIRGYAIP